MSRNERQGESTRERSPGAVARIDSTGDQPRRPHQTLSADPQEGRSPTGDRVTLLRIEFPVADPDHPQALWTWASCMIEVPGDRARGKAEELRGGASVLVAGQLSDRWMIEGGHTSRRGVLVASLIHPGPPSDRRGDLFVVGGGS